MKLLAITVMFSISPVLRAAGGTAGDNLLEAMRCTACHAASARQAEWLLPNPSPRLADVGSRANAEWLRRFLHSPQETLPGTTMPDMLHGNAEHAEALTHYLVSLGQAKFRRVMPDRAAVARGETLYQRIGCAACHASRNATTNAMSSAPAPHMAEKWSFEGLRRFLRDPLASRPAGRMPAMHLTDGEAADIAHYLLRETQLAREDATEPAPFVVDAAKAANGRALYTELNCAVCHEAKPSTNPPPALAALQIARGCLAERPAANAPDYHLDAAQRDALRRGLADLNRADLASPSPRQRVAHTMASFQCSSCHLRDGRGGATPERDGLFTSNGEDLGDEGRLPPRLDGVGDRLHPAWLSNVLAHAVGVRPYVNTRMPQFGEANVGHLAELFIALDRRPQAIEPVPDSPEVQRVVGRTLAGTDGLSCIACHRFNRQPAHALQVTDLATTTERLNEDWFRRFLRDPNRFHPGTRMPAFWPEGVSPLPALLGGSTDRQHAALWMYLADGSRARFPEGLSRQNMELVVGGEAVVYRGKLWEAGFRAVATGYPGQLNTAFDAEEMRLALVWRGRFLNAGPHWGVQGMGQIRPLGTGVVVFPHGVPLAVLADGNAPWPTESSKAAGMKFSGYQLDALKRPTLLYSFRNVAVEDFVNPIEATGGASLRRTLRFADPPPEGLHLRLAVGRLAPSGDYSWRLGEALTLTVRSGGKPFTRGQGDQQELLVPIRLPELNHPLELEYVW